MASARDININAGWEFQRIDKNVKATVLHNQGTDWNSQYSTEHVDKGGSSLAVPQDTLTQELRLLQQGRWEQVSLPHTPRMEPLVVISQWQGVCYYRRHLSVSQQQLQGLIFLRFDGAMSLADVWVNGRHASQHSGGYTPFTFDITKLLKAGDNEILVRLDNRDNALIPPGKPLGELDFNYYGGLYRNVWLVEKPKLHITDAVMANLKARGGIFVTYPEVSESMARIHVNVTLANAGSTRKPRLLFVLREWSRRKPRGRIVAKASTSVLVPTGSMTDAQADIRLPQPRLWSPDSPSLYLLEAQVMEKGKVTDQEQLRIGIRHIEATHDRGFLINGKPLWLNGTNRHQEYPYVGYALSDNAHYRDMRQIRENGFNIVRLGHYPQAPAVLDACDELGLLAIEPIPGWQFFNKDTAFVNHTYQDVRDLIRRDRNHPSIVMWETTLNESAPPAWWKDRAIAVAHEEMPGDQCLTSGDTYGYTGFDVCYNDWEEGFHRPNKTQKPSFIREYYDYEFGGHYSTTRIGLGDGDRALMQNLWNAQWSYNRYRKQYPQTIGAAVWSMYDYNRGCCDNICKSGTADIFRLPKFSQQMFRLQQPAGTPLPSGPMPHEVFIASHWMSNAPDTVVVYGNVDEVELRLNGNTIARQHADQGPDTDYKPISDAGNCRQMAYPPFTFLHVPRQTGELKAIGYSQGKPVADTTVRTPEAPDRLRISYFESGRKASRDDLLIIYVRVEDRRGTLCFGDNSTSVALTAEGGEVVGPAETRCEAGIASFLVRTRNARRLTLTAKTSAAHIISAQQTYPL